MFIYFLLCSICRGIVYFSFRNNRLFINDDFIIRQSGAWDVDNEIIEPGKIEATSQLFWHKSVIGSITHTAACPSCLLHA
jgi:putative membrane protein